MTKPLSKTIKPVPDENQSHKGPGSAPSVPIDTTKGHRDDEKHNIREQAAHGNIVQNTSNKRSGGSPRFRAKRRNANLSTRHSGAMLRIERGIHQAAEKADEWISGSRPPARRGITRGALTLSWIMQSSLRGTKRRSNPAFPLGTGLLRFVRNDGRTNRKIRCPYGSGPAGHFNIVIPGRRVTDEPENS